MINLKKVETELPKKIKIAWFSNHITMPTGYRVVISNICSRLAKDPLFEIHLLGEGGKERGDVKWKNCTLWGVGNNPNDFMKNTLAIVNRIKPDILMFLEDTFTLGNFGFPLYRFPCRVGMYCPQDGNGIPDMGVEVMRNLDFIVPMSSFSKQVCEREQFKTEEVILHGVDLNTFCPVSEERQKELKVKWGFKPDDYVIFNMGRNSGRKNNQTMIQALFEFLKDKPDNVKAFLHIMHADLKEGNLYSFTKRYMGIETGKDYLGKRIIINDGIKAKLTDSQVAELYKMCDMIISTSIGEGCLLGSQKIVTNKGILPIEKIHMMSKENLFVTTRNGTKQKIVCSSKRKHKGNLYEILVGKINQKLILTPEHKIYVTKRKNKNNKRFVRADSINSDNYLVFPKKMFNNNFFPKKKIRINQVFGDVIKIKDRFYKIQETYNKYLKLTEKRVHHNDFGLPDIEMKDFSKLLGIYLAEGHGTKGECIFSLSSEKDYEMKEFLKYFSNKYSLPLRIRKHNYKKLVNYIMSNNLLNKLLFLFGNKLAKNKEINRVVFEKWSNQDLKNLLKFMWLGDGNLSEKYGFEYSTISEKLALNICEILNRFNIIYSFERNNRKNKSERIKKERCISYRIRILDNRMKKRFFKTIFNKNIKLKDIQNTYFEDKNFFYLPITNIKKIDNFNDYVYDLEVERHGSFCTNVGVVHNSGLLNMEGCACAKPIIHCSYSTLFENLIEERNGIGARGILVDPILHVVSSYNVEHGYVDYKQFTKAMNKVYYDKELAKKLGENGRKFAERYFNWDEMVWNQWIPLFKRNI